MNRSARATAPEPAESSESAQPDAPTDPRPSRFRAVSRVVLSLFMLTAGVAHLTVARDTFQAQVPEWVPADPDRVVVGSGVAEVALGAGLLVIRGKKRRVVAGALALFFVAIFPGNISQFVTRTDAFGLTSDTARGVRLLFQPVLVLWALYAGGFLRRRSRRPKG
ncbi:MAG: DoxX family protein [Mycetocola sp.]